MKTLLDTLNGGTEWLERRGIENARRNMQLMLCEALGLRNPMHLYTDFDRPMSEQELIILRDMLKRRSIGEPLQHIIGWVEFYKRDFFTDDRALIPRPETEELVCLILNQEHRPKPRILDLGTGSGVIGLSLVAELDQSHVTLVDLSQEALELAKKNAASLSIEQCTFLQSDLFSNLSTGEAFDIIAANLPYIPENERGQLSREVDHDPDLALFGGSDGLDLIRQCISVAANFLKPNGLIALEIGIGQDKQVEKLLADAGYSAIQIFPDLNGIARFPLARKPIINN
jgi:release factor glutamine methyltransferase